MSQQGVLMGDGVRNPAGNEAISTSGESANQNIPPPPPGGEDVGGSLAPQDNVLPGVSIYGSDGVPILESMRDVGAQSGTSLVPYGEASAVGSASDGLIDPSQSFGPT